VFETEETLPRDALARNFADPSSWMTVVVFGILINVTAAYFRPALDRLAAYRTRSS
jgi:hypothetical protein